jgi:hypothetical protein
MTRKEIRTVRGKRLPAPSSCQEAQMTDEYEQRRERSAFAWVTDPLSVVDFAAAACVSGMGRRSRPTRKGDRL